MPELAQVSARLIPYLNDGVRAGLGEIPVAYEFLGHLL